MPRPTNEPRFKRARLPLPVYSGPRCWRLECQCGTVLNTCPCSPDREKVHIEVWRDGCAFVARWYPAPTAAPAPITAKTATQEAFITAFPLTRARRAHVAVPPAPPPIASSPRGQRRAQIDEEALAVRWQSGEAPSVIALDLEVSPDTLYSRMRALGITRPPTNALAGQEGLLRAMTAQGLSQAAMARRLGVTPTLVCRALQVLGVGGWKRGPRGRTSIQG